MTTVALRDTGAQSDSWLLSCLEQVLKPIIRLFLSRRVTFQAFTEVAKRIYIELAQEDAVKKNPRQAVTVSEIAIATGIDANTVRHYMNEPQEQAAPSLSPEAAILDQWASDHIYRDQNTGVPLELPIRGKGLTFATLVRRTQRNVSYGHVLDTLLDTKNVVLSRDSKSVRLKSEIYLPGTHKVRELMEAASRCIEHFLGTLNWNLSGTSTAADFPFFQQERFTTKLHPDKIGLFRREARSMLRQQTDYAADILAPIEDSVKTNEHHYAGVGYYYFEVPKS